jgi:hypothetical protein
MHNDEHYTVLPQTLMQLAVCTLLFAHSLLEEHSLAAASCGD